MTLESPLANRTDDRRFSRAQVYTALGAFAALLTLWFMVNNVFLVPLTGGIGIFCVLRGWKHGGRRPVLLTIALVSALPAVIAIVALISLIPNLPALDLNGVSIEK